MGARRAQAREHFIKEISDLVIGEEITHKSVWQSDNSKQMENRNGSDSQHKAACQRVVEQPGDPSHCKVCLDRIARDFFEDGYVSVVKQVSTNRLGHEKFVCAINVLRLVAEWHVGV